MYKTTVCFVKALLKSLYINDIAIARCWGEVLEAAFKL